MSFICTFIPFTPCFSLDKWSFSWCFKDTYFLFLVLCWHTILINVFLFSQKLVCIPPGFFCPSYAFLYSFILKKIYLPKVCYHSKWESRLLTRNITPKWQRLEITGKKIFQVIIKKKKVELNINFRSVSSQLRIFQRLPMIFKIKINVFIMS